MEAADRDAPLAKAIRTVFRLMKFRPRSEWEIVEKLKSRHLASETISAALEYFKKLDYVDDHRFAKAWTASRLIKIGINRIRLELKEKGIAKEIIQETLDHIPQEYSEIDSILKIAQKRLSKYQNLDSVKSKRRLYEYLARQGFQQSTIHKALRQLFKKNHDHE